MWTPLSSSVVLLLYVLKAVVSEPMQADVLIPVAVQFALLQRGNPAEI